jgi:hypothetical protein
MKYLARRRRDTKKERIKKWKVARIFYRVWRDPSAEPEKILKRLAGACHLKIR